MNIHSIKQRGQKMTIPTVKNSILRGPQAPRRRHRKPYRVLRDLQNTLQMGGDARGGLVYHGHQEEISARHRTKKDGALGVPVQD